MHGHMALKCTRHCGITVHSTYLQKANMTAPHVFNHYCLIPFYPTNDMSHFTYCISYIA
jgi:hypothetical protein